MIIHASKIKCKLYSTSSSFFFFNDTATTEIYTLSLHDALPISRTVAVVVPSPASSEVAEATSFTICAPMFSRSEEHTSELQSLAYLVCRLLLEKKKQLPREHAQIYNKQQYRLLDAQMETRLNAP